MCAAGAPPALVLPEELAEIALKWRLQWSKSVGEGKKVLLKQKLGELVPLDAQEQPNPEGKPIPLFSPINGWIKTRCFRNNVVLHSSLAASHHPLLIFSNTSLCKHDVLLQGGLCAQCGELLTPSQVASSSSGSDLPDQDMIKLGFVSSDTEIRVSKEVASTLTAGKISSLLKSRKLILVLDLDHTLVHASDVGRMREFDDRSSALTFEEAVAIYAHSPKTRDIRSVIPFECEDVPTLVKTFTVQQMDDTSPLFDTEHTNIVAHYIQDAENHSAAGPYIRVLENEVFRVRTAGVVAQPNGMLCRYVGTTYFKLRPQVIRFLREMTKIFELYLFTAGTKEHADSALRLLDPERRFFGNRVFARKALSGDGTKSLAQILPTDHEMICVLDDTQRVWADDVALLTCYPYVWFAEEPVHFLMPVPQLIEPLVKMEALRSAFCQYSPAKMRHILSSFGKEVPTFQIGNNSKSAHEQLAGWWRLANIDQITDLRPPERLDDSDLQLESAISIFSSVHHIFFAVLDRQKGLDEIALPSCKMILDFLRKQVLANTISLYQGDPSFAQTDLCRLATSMGTKIIYHTDLQLPTHSIPAIEATSEALAPVVPGISTIDFTWLMFAAFTFVRPSEELFTPDRVKCRRIFWDVAAISEKRSHHLRRKGTLSHEDIPTAKRRRTVRPNNVTEDFSSRERDSMSDLSPSSTQSMSEIIPAGTDRQRDPFGVSDELSNENDTETKAENMSAFQCHGREGATDCSLGERSETEKPCLHVNVDFEAKTFLKDYDLASFIKVCVDRSRTFKPGSLVFDMPPNPQFDEDDIEAELISDLLMHLN